MAYKIEFDPKAGKSLVKLPKEVRRRIRTKINSLAENPRPHGVEKLSGEENSYRVRVGVYRIVYEIHDKRLVILILDIDHRKDIYR